MADNGEGGGGNSKANIAELRKQVLTLVTRNFEGTVEKPIDDVVSRVLSKRRKKWRKRHNLSSEVATRPPDPALRSEKERLTDQYYQIGEQLLVCRRNGYATVRQLERDKRRMQLQVAESCHERITRQPSDSRSSEPSTIAAHERSSVLQDLEKALSQVDALAKVRQMKLSMTPRLPPLHRRDSQEKAEQFGMSLLVPPQQVMMSPLPTNQDAGDIMNTNREHPVLSKLLTSNVASEETTEQEPLKDLCDTVTVSDSVPTATAGTSDCHVDLDPAVELSPINRDHEMNFNDEDDERGSLSPEELPRIACIMSLMEGQDTASVVEVMADNDIVIETNSSMSHDDREEPTHLDNSFDERLMLNNVLPEKEEIVSTTPDNIEDFMDSHAICTESAANHTTTTASLEDHRDINHLQTTDEELVEMIMKDSELAAWIAKARLRPRTPISYTQTRKKRHSRSRSSSVHD